MNAPADITWPSKVLGLSNEAYHAHPSISSSAINTALRSPLHYHAQYVARAVERTESASMRLGTMVHTAVLEPDEWSARYIVAPDVDRRTKAGKEAWAQFLAEAKGYEVITNEEAAKAHAMAAVVLEHPAAGPLLRGDFVEPEREASYFWRDAETGLECRCRPDSFDGEIIVDLKTTKDASPSFFWRDDEGRLHERHGGFARSVANYGYHVQAAWYRRGVEAVTGRMPRHVIVAVETTAPYAVAVYELDALALEEGERLCQRAITTIAECQRVGRWPGYGDEIQRLGLPRWAVMEVQS